MSDVDDIRRSLSRIYERMDRISGYMDDIKRSVGITLPDSYDRDKRYELQLFVPNQTTSTRAVVGTAGTDSVGQEATDQGTTPLTEEEKVTV